MRNSRNPQELLTNQKELSLSGEKYDTSKSRVKVMLNPPDKKAWKSYGNQPTSIVSSL